MDLPDQIYMLAPPDADVQKLADTFRLDFPGLKVTTTTDLRRDNQDLAGIINQLVVVMGLVALLMGSVGIMHTMLVSVGRRTTEIAVLKTIGARNGQIIVVFLTEATMMGAIGSSIGLLLGVALSLGARTYAQSIWPQAIGWRIYPEATLSGLALGTVLTVVFCFLPTVRAVSVRPKVVLHPEENAALKIGLWPNMLALLLATVVVGTLVGGIIGDALPAGRHGGLAGHDAHPHCCTEAVRHGLGAAARVGNCRSEAGSKWYPGLSGTNSGHALDVNRRHLFTQSAVVYDAQAADLLRQTGSVWCASQPACPCHGAAVTAFGRRRHAEQQPWRRLFQTAWCLNTSLTANLIPITQTICFSQAL
jgi:hypothetical protein